MANIRRLVLDTLKPHEPGIIDMSIEMADLEGVTAVNISIYEMDRNVENAKITIEGENIPYDVVSKVIDEMGASIHSIDEVVAGKKLIDDAESPVETPPGSATLPPVTAADVRSSSEVIDPARPLRRTAASE